MIKVKVSYDNDTKPPLPESMSDWHRLTITYEGDGHLWQETVTLPPRHRAADLEDELAEALANED